MSESSDMTTTQIDTGCAAYALEEVLSGYFRAPRTAGDAARAVACIDQAASDLGLLRCESTATEAER